MPGIPYRKARKNVLPALPRLLWDEGHSLRTKAFRFAEPVYRFPASHKAFEGSDDVGSLGGRAQFARTFERSLPEMPRSDFQGSFLRLPLRTCQWWDFSSPLNCHKVMHANLLVPSS